MMVTDDKRGYTVNDRVTALNSSLLCSVLLCSRSKFIYNVVVARDNPLS